MSGRYTNCSGLVARMTKVWNRVPRMITFFCLHRYRMGGYRSHQGSLRYEVDFGDGIDDKCPVHSCNYEYAEESVSPHERTCPHSLEIAS